MYIGQHQLHDRRPEALLLHAPLLQEAIIIAAIFYPFSQFCEIGVSLLSQQKQPKTAPNLFQRGVEYGKYDYVLIIYYIGKAINIIRLK